MSIRSVKTAGELQDMIVEQARVLHGPWPSGMTIFVFDDAYGWSASISRPISEGRRFLSYPDARSDQDVEGQL